MNTEERQDFPDERQDFRRHQLRTARFQWWTSFGLAVAVGLAIGFAWSFAIGFPVAAVLMLGAFELQLRLSKRRWIRRFPELADPGTKWRRV